MKAEHRKELQTNALADFLGRTVRTARTSEGIPWFKLGVVAVVILGGLLAWWIIASKARIKADNWQKVDQGDRDALMKLLTDAKDTKPGQAAGFTIGYSFLWDSITTLGMADPDKAKSLLGSISSHFAQLAEECKDDPERCAEAKYHLAVAAEAITAVEALPLQKKQLEEAKRLFTEVAQGDLATTAYGKIAQKRVEQYNNPQEFQRIERFYTEFMTGARLGKLGL